MALAQRITKDNFDTLLVQSSQSRSGSPDGNIFFDAANGLIEIITREEMAQVDLGSGLEDNPLTDYHGITMRALYNFEDQERSADETLRQYAPFFGASSKFANAYVVINGRGFAGNDRQKIRNSGWVERNSDNTINRIYFGIFSLGNIEATSQPYYQIPADTSESALRAATAINFNRQGPVSEAIQVFGDTSHGDAGAGNFDYTLRPLYARLRTFNYFFDSDSSIDSGLGELNGFSAGFGMEESLNSANNFDIADVYGGSAISPWTGMRLDILGHLKTRTGFVSGSADFSYILHNDNNGSLAQCKAYLDAIAIQNTDIDSGAGSIIGKRANEWYSSNSDGNTVTTAGLHIDNLPESDKLSIIQTDDSETGQIYPFNVEIRIEVGADAVSDTNAWYHVFIEDGAGGLDFGTVNAVTANDASGSPMKGNISSDASGSQIVTSFAYDTNTQAGLSAGIDKNLIVLVEGDGGVKTPNNFYCNQDFDYQCQIVSLQ
jgi:hypothetical protein